MCKTFPPQNSCGKFIPGNYWDTSLGPKGVSSLGWHHSDVSVPDGFEITHRAHKAEWRGEGDNLSRQQPSNKFTTKLIESPDMHPDDYSVKRSKNKILGRLGLNKSP